MNTKDITYLLNNPFSINEKQTMYLEIVLQQYPFFQSLKALHLKGLYNQDSFRYNYELKKTAAHTTDRSILFDFITSENFTTLQKNNIENIDDYINNITVVDSIFLKMPTTVSEIKFEEKEIKTENEPTIELITDFEKVDITISEETKIETTTVIEAEIEQNEIEEKLEIGKPLDFNQSEKHSFQEWLQLTKFSPIEREDEEETEVLDPEKLKKIDIIDRFIELNPKISPVKASTPIPSNIRKTTEEPTHLMTETLAKVYLEQKKYQKAIQAYEILILKYPEKSSFFANRINDIKDLQQNNN
ncbi:tetratricopeptide repeat protein [Flavobacterium sp.]|uniref:tetratricopeptide repeat protein n=1 Tax=Flavobacterium sp. TaxID=239 RepID=UPI0040486229